jgi:hypothetical protein
MNSPLTRRPRSLFTALTLSLAFAVALTALFGGGSADAHWRIKRPSTRKLSAAHHKQHRVAVTGKKGRGTWQSSGDWLARLDR